MLCACMCNICGFCLGLNPIWVFPKIGVPQNRWFIMENPIEMDDLGARLFSETSILLCSPLTRRCSTAQAARSNSSLTVNPAVPPVKKASMASRRPEHLGRPGERHTNHRAQSVAQASLAPPHCPHQLRCPLPALWYSPGSGRKC